MKNFRTTEPRAPLSARALNSIFGIAAVGWAILFAYGAVITHVV